MLTAIRNGERTRALPHTWATCPGCRSEVLAKCGTINIWHWAHPARQDCDPWYEGESAWHLTWKSFTPMDRVEVVMGPHRADVVMTDGTVLELQHSALSPAEVWEREGFYGRMIWLVDLGHEALKNLSIRERDGYWSFRWRWPRKWMFAVNQTLLWDFGGKLFHVRKLHADLPCGGWGNWIPRQQFISAIKGWWTARLEPVKVIRYSDFIRSSA